MFILKVLLVYVILSEVLCLFNVFRWLKYMFDYHFISNEKFEKKYTLLHEDNLKVNIIAFGACIWLFVIIWKIIQNQY